MRGGMGLTSKNQFQLIRGGDLTCTNHQVRMETMIFTPSAKMGVKAVKGRIRILSIGSGKNNLTIKNGLQNTDAEFWSGMTMASS